MANVANVSNVSYASAPWPVRADIIEAHERAWLRLARPGAWWTGKQRVAIAAEVRNASRCPLCSARKHALSPYSVNGTHASLGELPGAVVEVIHRVRTDSGRVTQRWLQGVLADGLSEEEYVETIAVVATTVAVDTFTRALGLPLHPLPLAEAGEPTCRRPKGAKHDGAWVSWVQSGDVTEEEAGLYPPGRPAPNIMKAMSLVPPEVRGFFDLVETQYLPGSAMRDFAREHRAISHEQIELIASRVSALNGCEY